MSNHNNSVTFVVDGLELLHDGVRTAGVEVAGGFVGEDNFGITNDGAGDSNALLLTTRKLVGKIVFFFLQIEALEGTGSLFEPVNPGVTRIDKRKGDVFQNR